MIRVLQSIWSLIEFLIFGKRRLTDEEIDVVGDGLLDKYSDR